MDRPLIIESNQPFISKISPADPDKRITPRYLTKFEQARILGTRAYQLSMGAPAHITITDKGGHLDPLVLARRELANNAIPIIIRRHLPDGTYEDWKLSELHIID
ncbi:DNA-directed RNA polymerase I/ II/ and III/ subunit 6/II RPB6 [Giardia duodenalis assemblage B]|uniref:DNA-directed RNA polymerase I/ II/ and III/ subunit 6/II RPB6 n=3 Tax=Giardia intestinalis TaxID=5741 RepID=A0A132NU99_GIAIN|nr:DNA-directed RNA polymerase II RPB6 [Giardia intestinalis ATCC 50581]ESU42808.1 DNA-directed RNA polymerase I, II, AND III, subunit 6 [Giardia intestinalis]KWX13651.1 DNA-directed RNA polymerase I/ II/ and III/ subunit 6/II RPB6 [Giardia intestinalis assemblage B]